jgi:hypothetical protein
LEKAAPDAGASPEKRPAIFPYSASGFHDSPQSFGESDLARAYEANKLFNIEARNSKGDPRIPVPGRRARADIDATPKNPTFFGI